jgi:hypothetical protein
LYLEHGNQYEVLDAFPDFLNPTLRHDERLIRLPPGSFFSRYFFNKVEQSFSFADNLRPVTRFIAWAFQNRFWTTVGLFVKYRAELWHFGRELLRRGLRDYLQDRKQQKELESAAYQTALHTSARGPLSPEHLEKISQLALEERSKPVSKILHYGIVALPILVFVLIALGLLGIFVVPAFSAWIFPQNYFLRLIISGAVAFGIKYLLAPAIAVLVRVRDYLLKPAQRIWEILQEPMGSDEAPRVRYLVFGHTHEPNMQQLGREKDAPWYINTGSWLYTISEVESWERLDRDFIFLQIVPGQEAEIPRLFRWNEATGRPERIRRRLPESLHDHR